MLYPFIDKLLRMLNDPDTQDIASWSEDGTSIIIHDLREFEAKVLSKHFPYGRSDSFCRQLNIYNFKRTSDARKQRQSPNSRVSTFRHPYFQRGRMDLINKIKRNKPQRIPSSTKTLVRLPPINHQPASYQPGQIVLPPIWAATQASSQPNLISHLLNRNPSSSSSNAREEYNSRTFQTSLPSSKSTSSIFSIKNLIG